MNYNDMYTFLHVPRLETNWDRILGFFFFKFLLKKKFYQNEKLMINFTLYIYLPFGSILFLDDVIKRFK